MGAMREASSYWVSMDRMRNLKKSEGLLDIAKPVIDAEFTEIDTCIDILA